MSTSAWGVSGETRVGPRTRKLRSGTVLPRPGKVRTVIWAARRYGGFLRRLLLGTICSYPQTGSEEEVLLVSHLGNYQEGS